MLGVCESEASLNDVLGIPNIPYLTLKPAPIRTGLFSPASTPGTPKGDKQHGAGYISDRFILCLLAFNMDAWGCLLGALPYRLVLYTLRLLSGSWHQPLPPARPRPEKKSSSTALSLPPDPVLLALCRRMSVFRQAGRGEGGGPVRRADVIAAGAPPPGAPPGRAPHARADRGQRQAVAAGA
jgi:hypothetical protein